MENLPENYQDVCKADMNVFQKIYHAWIQNGVYLGPSGYEVGFLSYSHTKNDLTKCVQVIQESLK